MVHDRLLSCRDSPESVPHESCFHKLMTNKLVVVALGAMSLAMPAFAQNRLAASGFPMPVPEYLASTSMAASKTYGVDPNLIAAIAFRESRFDPAAVSRRGAQGVLQLMPKTARALGVHNAFDARDNIFGGTK